MEEREVVSLIQHGREERNLEYKGCVRWEKDVRAQITKSILAMSNIRDGGTIVIGIQQQGEKFIPNGLDATDLGTFTQDDISSYVNEYADPFADIVVSHVPYEGKDFVVIQVREFLELPVICKKDGACGLRRGAVYTRPYRRCESAEVPGQAEMRDILDMALEKGMRGFLRMVGRAGLEVAERSQVDRTDKERFREQLTDFYQDVRVQPIKAKGYWEVIIRPTSFEQRRIESLARCSEIVRKSAVYKRGWDYPHLDRNGPTSGNDWVESHYGGDGLCQYWRYYQSGQFVDYFVCREDYELDPDEIRRDLRSLGAAKAYLEILNTLYRVTEIFEFAARLASIGALSSVAEISISLYGTEGRQLVILDWSRAPLMRDYICKIPCILLSWTPDARDLCAQASERALNATVDIFERFNWMNPPKDILRADQEKFLD